MQSLDLLIMSAEIFYRLTAYNFHEWPVIFAKHIIFHNCLFFITMFIVDCLYYLYDGLCNVFPYMYYDTGRNKREIFLS